MVGWGNKRPEDHKWGAERLTNNIEELKKHLCMSAYMQSSPVARSKYYSVFTNVARILEKRMYPFNDPDTSFFPGIRQDQLTSLIMTIREPFNAMEKYISFYEHTQDRTPSIKMTPIVAILYDVKNDEEVVFDPLNSFGALNRKVEIEGEFKDLEDLRVKLPVKDIMLSLGLENEKMAKEEHLLKYAIRKKGIL